MSEVVKDQLLSIARMMAKEQQTKRSFRGDDLGGVMRTDYSSRHLGFISGVLFTAEVSHSGGDTRVEFLATPAELKQATDGFWGTGLLILEWPE